MSGLVSATFCETKITKLMSVHSIDAWTSSAI